MRTLPEEVCIGLNSPRNEQLRYRPADTALFIEKERLGNVFINRDAAMNPTLIIAVALTALGGFVSLANWWNVYQSYRTKRFHSCIPFIGAGLLGAGMLIMPATRPYCWSAVIFDYGTLSFFLALPRLIREFWRTNWINLTGEYLGQDSAMTVRLRLFRHGVFSMHIQIHRPPGQSGLAATNIVGTWQRDATCLTLQAEREAATFKITANAPTEILRQAHAFSNWETRNGLSLSGIDLKLQPRP